MNTRIVILLCGSLLVFGCQDADVVQQTNATPAAAGPLEAGTKAPDFSLKGTDGKTYTLASLTERGPAFVYFMKHNCSANPEAVPLMSALSNAYAGKVNFVAVTTGDKEQAESEGAQYGFKPVQLLDKDHKLIAPFGLEASQHTYLIGQDGVIKEAFHGYGMESLTRLSKALAAEGKVEVAKVDLAGAPNRVAYG